MSTKIIVSYSNDQELQKIIKLLNPITKHIKRRNNQDGKYKKADITIAE